MLHSQAQMHSSFLMIRRTEKRVGRPGYEDRTQSYKLTLEG